MSLQKRLEFSKKPIFLMDGSAYVFRSFYANQNMSRADGMPTNVLYMVLRLLFKIIREQSPAYFAFILDGRGKNFRHRLYPEYKAQRLATPEPLSAQIEPLCKAIDALGLFVTFSNDCEADDCIASLSHQLSKEQPVVIIGADKDLKQCLAPNVAIWDPSSKEERITTLDDFIKEQGFKPSSWPDYQAIIGDSSDNIPGIPGIGPKGASTLMHEFSSLEEIYERLAAIPPALRKKLEGFKEQALLYRKLTTLKLDTCQDISLEQLIPKPPEQSELMECLNKFELRSLARELASMLRISTAINTERRAENNASLASAFATAQIKEQKTSTQSSIELCKPNPLAAVSKQSPDLPMANQAWEQGSLFEAQPSFPDSLDWQNLPELKDFSDLSGSKNLVLIPVKEFGGEKQQKEIILGNGVQDFICKPEFFTAPENIKSMLQLITDKTLISSNIKELCEEYPLLAQLPIRQCFDLSVAAWLLSPEEYNYSFAQLNRLWGAEAGALCSQMEKTFTAAQFSSLPIAMQIVMQQRLEANKLNTVMENIEMPLIPVLLSMQMAGIGINKEAFSKFLQETESELAELSSLIYKSAGKEFNIRSAKQLGEVLFNDLQLPKAGKTSGGQASTSQESLERLAGKHPVIDFLLTYRKLEKLRSTYLDPLPKLADFNNRVHTSFNQTATATGRLSSSNPNLQNIPVRGALGSRMRTCFTSAPGNLIVSADYSQIELRVLAHMSQDQTLLDSFRKDEDIHLRTASLLFDCPPEKITPDQRRNAKTINFGLIYGMGPQSLAKDLGISMKEAKAFIAKYFERLEKLKHYFEQVEKEAQTHGYVCTMTGRRRNCPEILSQNQQLRSRARRQAINTCIQGSAADIIKLAMLNTANDQVLKNLGAKLILQIHDELLLECCAENAQTAGKRLSEIMSAVAPGGQKLSIPLKVEWGTGTDWNAAH